jgi:hypothetical protein
VDLTGYNGYWRLGWLFGDKVALGGYGSLWGYGGRGDMVALRRYGDFWKKQWLLGDMVAFRDVTALGRYGGF